MTGGTGRGHALSSPAKCRTVNGKKRNRPSAMFTATQRFALSAARLTVTIARRKSGKPLSESFEMRILSDFVSERVPHAFRRCRDKIRVVEIAVVRRHCERMCRHVRGADTRRRRGDTPSRTIALTALIVDQSRIARSHITVGRREFLRTQCSLLSGSPRFFKYRHHTHRGYDDIFRNLQFSFLFHRIPNNNYLTQHTFIRLFRSRYIMALHFPNSAIVLVVNSNLSFYLPRRIDV